MDGPDAGLEVPAGEQRGSDEDPVTSGWRVVQQRRIEEVFDLVARTVRDRGAAGDVAADALVAELFNRLSQQPELPAAEEERLAVLAAAHALVITESGARREREPSEPRWDLASPTGGEEGLAREAAEVVWRAAGGLNRAQYALLDLSVRRRLTPAELGRILGVSERQAEARLGRARDALLKRVRMLMLSARRPHCEQLASLIPGRTRTLTVEQHLALDRHVRDCSACGPLAARLADPLGILAGLAGAPVPPSTRSWSPAPPDEREPARIGAEPPVTAAPAHGGWLRPRWAWLQLSGRWVAGGVGALAVLSAGIVLAATRPWAGGAGRASTSSDRQHRGPTPPPQPVSVTFGPSAAVQRFTVPCGTRTLHLEMAAGSGGIVPGGAAPGRGGTAIADVPVQPGQLLLVVVGANGLTASGSGGGGGGGGTGLGVTTSEGLPAGDLIAVGGGGGAGGSPIGIPGSGGAGGDADSPGAPATGPMGGGGGAAGTQNLGSPGGPGGRGSSANGMPGGGGTHLGGVGGAPNGGGGATGHFSGGGGGGGGSTGRSTGGGGGGGGGATYVQAGVVMLQKGVDLVRSPHLTVTHPPSTCG